MADNISVVIIVLRSHKGLLAITFPKIFDFLICGIYSAGRWVFDAGSNFIRQICNTPTENFSKNEKS